MIIVSHGAAAALSMVAYSKVKGDKKLLTAGNIGKMFLLGTLPDIPLTVLVISGKFDPSIHYHHTWITHTPVFWLIVSLIVMKFISRKAGFALLAATWLHLGMDWYGGADGIPFLYPFTDQQFGAGLHGVNGPEGFEIYFKTPIFLALKILVQGSFFALVLAWLTKKIIKKKN